MRKALLVLTLAAACGRSAAPAPEVFISVDADAIPTVSALAAGDMHVERVAGGAAVIAVPADELEQLSERMHAEHARCGGFMVHDSLDDALAAIAAPAAPAPIEYTLDHAAEVKATLPKLSADNIKKTIGELQAMKNRYFQSESGAAASAWLRDRWRSFSERTDITIELVDHGYPQKSVVMTIPGTTKPDEIVVIGGHLDSISQGGARGTAPGADDDASGIATLTEIARVLLQNDYRPARTVKFMAYAAEEVGLRGSLKIAKSYREKGVNVVGALQLDMTNYQGSDRDIWLIDDHTDHDQNAFMVKLIESYTGATWGVDRCGYACSDHASWTRYGFRSSMPFEARFRDMNNQIHTKQDTLEMSGNNAAHAVKFARLGAAYALELAKGTIGSQNDAPAIDTAEDSGDHSSRRWPYALVAAAGLGALALRKKRR